MIFPVDQSHIPQTISGYKVVKHPDLVTSTAPARQHRFRSFYNYPAFSAKGRYRDRYHNRIQKKWTKRFGMTTRMIPNPIFAEGTITVIDSERTIHCTESTYHRIRQAFEARS